MSTTETLLGADAARQVVALARIRITREDLATLSGQINEILAYVRQLQAVPTDGVEPTSHVLPLANVMRADEIAPSLDPSHVLAMAPARHGQLVKVPKIIDV